jgi:hypothetical protein
MRDKTKTLMKALTRHIANKATTGKECLVHQEAVRQAFQTSSPQASGVFTTRPVGSTYQRSLANGVPASRAAIHSAV